MDNKQVVARFGNFTSSEIGKLLKSSKTKGVMFGDTAMTYIHEKIAELLTHERKQNVSGYALEWGTNQEPKAMQHYIDFYKQENVTYYGAKNFKYFEHPEITLSGGSPDFVQGIICGEIKAPLNSSNHIEVLIGEKSENHNEWLKKYNDLYYAQLQWNIECCKCERGIFLSYDPRVTDMQKAMAILHIEKDNDLISELKTRLNAAIKIVNDFLQS